MAKTLNHSNPEVPWCLMSHSLAVTQRAMLLQPLKGGPCSCDLDSPESARKVRTVTDDIVGERGWGDG